MMLYCRTTSKVCISKNLTTTSRCPYLTSSLHILWKYCRTLGCLIICIINIILIYKGVPKRCTFYKRLMWKMMEGSESCVMAHFDGKSWEFVNIKINFWESFSLESFQCRYMWHWFLDIFWFLDTHTFLPIHHLSQ